jgi:hypothetical protein
MNYLSGNPERFSLCKVNKVGLPLVLGSLKKHIVNDSCLVIAMIFTILFATRSLKINNEPDLSSITQPSKGGDVPDLGKFMVDF